MAQPIIANPILNSPFDEPKRHFYFDDDGITDKVVEARRLSSYFVPVPQPKKKGKHLVLDTEWTKDRVEENKFINAVRNTVSKWRFGGYDGTTNTTRQLLAYWRNPEREARGPAGHIVGLLHLGFAVDAAGLEASHGLAALRHDAVDGIADLVKRTTFGMVSKRAQAIHMNRKEFIDRFADDLDALIQEIERREQRV